jgi:hypothetical protein
MSFPPGTEMFQFPGFASTPYAFRCGSPCGGVSPFGHPRINDRSHLPAAFRSVPRPSSPLGAKASTERSYRAQHTTQARTQDQAPRQGRGGSHSCPATHSHFQPTNPMHLSNSTPSNPPAHPRQAGPTAISLGQRVAARQNLAWRRSDSNRRPPACKAGALPLSYAPGNRDRTSASATPRRAAVQRRSLLSASGGFSPPPAGRPAKMGQGGLEPPTPRLSSVCSDQLSYWPTAQGPLGGIPRAGTNPASNLQRPESLQAQTSPGIASGCAVGARAETAPGMRRAGIDHIGIRSSCQPWGSEHPVAPPIQVSATRHGRASCEGPKPDPKTRLQGHP